MLNSKNIVGPLTIICLLVSIIQVSADQITQSDRVTTHINVREAPDTDSEVVGILNPNETAELIESVPYWHHIKLSDGITGYVSKAWTQVISGSTTVPTTGKTDLIIGSWNIKHFGSRTDAKDYPRMADIIEKFDIMAIQELKGSFCYECMTKLKDELAGCGFKYTFVISKETGYKNNLDTNPSLKNDYLERYAFMWDIDRVQPFKSSVPYIFAMIPEINNDTFRQVPIYRDFKVKNGNGFDFRIFNIHTVYNKPLNAVRRAELIFINDWIIDQVQNAANTEKNIIAIGDFNANPDGQPHHFDEIISGATAYRVLFNEPLIAGELSLKTTIQQSITQAQDTWSKGSRDSGI